MCFLVEHLTIQTLSCGRVVKPWIPDSKVSCSTTYIGHQYWGDSTYLLFKNFKRLFLNINVFGFRGKNLEIKITRKPFTRLNTLVHEIFAWVLFSRSALARIYNPRELEWFAQLKVRENKFARFSYCRHRNFLLLFIKNWFQIWIPRQNICLCWKFQSDTVIR